MYRLLPWKFPGFALTAVVVLAVYVDELENITGINLPDHMVVRYLPIILILSLTVFFGSACRWAALALDLGVFPIPQQGLSRHQRHLARLHQFKLAEDQEDV